MTADQIIMALNFVLAEQVLKTQTAEARIQVLTQELEKLKAEVE